MSSKYCMFVFFLSFVVIYYWLYSFPLYLWLFDWDSCIIFVVWWVCRFLSIIFRLFQETVINYLFVENILVGRMKTRRAILQKGDYWGRIVRILFFRDWDAICEHENEKILSSEVIEEEMILWNIWLSGHSV